MEVLYARKSRIRKLLFNNEQLTIRITRLVEDCYLLNKANEFLRSENARFSDEEQRLMLDVANLSADLKFLQEIVASSKTLSPRTDALLHPAGPAR